MKTKPKKILSYLMIIIFIAFISAGCAVKKKHRTVPCPHFSLELFK